MFKNNPEVAALSVLDINPIELLALVSQVLMIMLKQVEIMILTVRIRARGVGEGDLKAAMKGFEHADIAIDGTALIAAFTLVF